MQNITMCYIEVGYACIEKLMMGNSGKTWTCFIILLQFVFMCPIEDWLALFQAMTRLRTGDM